MNKIVNGVANDYEFPMYYEPKISTNRQAGKNQQMFYELSIELSKKQQELDQYKNNWEELKKWLEQEWLEWKDCEDARTKNFATEDKIILNKMKELEENK